MLNWLRNKKPHKPVEAAAPLEEVHSESHYIKDGTLYVNNTPVVFKYPSKKSIEINQIFVVLLQPQQSAIYNENVFGVNSSGEVLWQIQEKLNPDLKEYKQPYMNIWINNKGEIQVNDSYGLNFLINPLDGSIQYAGFTK